MAISDSQKIDLLWKKIGFGKAKTDTNASKKAPNEPVASSLIIKDSDIWNQSSSITSVIPSANSSIAVVYSDAISDALEIVEDGSSSDNRTWKTNTTNWIPPGFGATYQLKVYSTTTGESNPQSTGDQLFETGSGNEDQWFFDYQSGVLHFIGDNLPTAIGTGTSNVIYVVGARYVGATGISTDSDSTGAATSYRKANLAAVYADNTINDGDMIEVTDNGDGEYAIYMSKQDAPTTTSHLTLVSTRDGGSSDAATLTADVTYDTGAVTLGDVSAGSKPISVVINVTAPFDGTTEITVGDGDNNSRLMSSAYVDLSETGTFVTNPSYVYSNSVDAQNTLRVYVTAGDSTQGNATILVSYA